MHRRALVVACALVAGLGVIAPARAAAPAQAAASSQAVTTYPDAAASTRFSGLGFDTCTAPSVAAMTAWLASPYRAVGVYVGGENRSCTQPRLTAAWVASATALGWRLMPTYIGRQAPCADRAGTKISRTASTAAAQGTTAADDAIAAVSSLGITPGSPVYYDLENYDSTDTSCRAAVLGFMAAYTQRLHAQGYLSAVYANLHSGARHLAAASVSADYARPDILWAARWDSSPTLTGLAGVGDDQWSVHQRAKQYEGDHVESWGGVSMNIDSDSLSTAVATVARGYVTRSGTTTLRAGPSTHADPVAPIAAGTAVDVLCQTHGGLRNGTHVWDRLGTGAYVSDAFVNTPSSGSYSPGIPVCSYPYQVSVTDSLTTRVTPSAAGVATGSIPAGGLAWVKCQTPGADGGGVWDRLMGNTYVADSYVADHSADPPADVYSPPIPRCY